VRADVGNPWIDGRIDGKTPSFRFCFCYFPFQFGLSKDGCSNLAQGFMTSPRRLCVAAPTLSYGEIRSSVLRSARSHVTHSRPLPTLLRRRKKSDARRRIRWVHGPNDDRFLICPPALVAARRLFRRQASGGTRSLVCVGAVRAGFVAGRTGRIGAAHAGDGVRRPGRRW
jgi:hypothetical protein